MTPKAITHSRGRCQADHTSALLQCPINNADSTIPGSRLRWARSRLSPRRGCAARVQQQPRQRTSVLLCDAHNLVDEPHPGALGHA